MKKRMIYILFSIVLLLSFSETFAQDAQIDTLNFEVAPLKEEKPPYFALGGGYTGTFLFLNFDELNNRFSNADFSLPNMKSFLYMSGVHGFTAIGIVPNLRIGFMGMWGSKQVQNDFSIKIPADTISETVTRGAEYTVSYNGLTLDYGIILFKSFALIPGVTAGWVNTIIESYQTPANTDWNNLSKPQTTNDNFLNRAEGSFYFVQPNLNAEYAVTPFLMVRVGVGYPLSFSSAWKYNRNATLKYVPKGINATGFTVQLGVFIGLFNY